MIKTHEISLLTSDYNTLLNSDSAIILDDTDKNIEQNDYVLFKQIQSDDNETKETGLYYFVKIKNVVSNHSGLKEGYIMINYTQIQ